MTSPRLEHLSVSGVVHRPAGDRRPGDNLARRVPAKMGPQVCAQSSGPFSVWRGGGCEG